jgi:hypothetical protein
LSAAAAARILRSIAYREWGDYHAPAEPAPAPTAPLSSHVSSEESPEADRPWYLNEVPTEWIDLTEAADPGVKSTA